MAQRLTDLYQSNDLVEIRFGNDDRWWLGRVRGHEPPGMWVETRNGRLWFVTNGRRVRAYASRGESEAG
ncbi:MAG: hypothetical protein AAF614_30825 [Chloroflexota bacterium]